MRNDDAGGRKPILEHPRNGVLVVSLLRSQWFLMPSREGLNTYLQAAQPARTLGIGDSPDDYLQHIGSRWERGFRKPLCK